MLLFVLFHACICLSDDQGSQIGSHFLFMRLTLQQNNTNDISRLLEQDSSKEQVSNRFIVTSRTLVDEILSNFDLI